jgi:endonuclease YncB( thermonuclease family)
MVESGMAFSYKDAYQQEEDLAKAEKLGFWGFYTPPIEPYKWRKLNRH